MANSIKNQRRIDKKEKASYEGSMSIGSHSFAAILSTWFGAGLSPRAPGTIGSLAGLPFIFLFKSLGGNSPHLGFTIFVVFLGWWAAEKYIKEKGGNDPQEVVIDEVAGLSIALLFAPLSWLSFFVGFALFRFFDILKPWPVSWADQKIKGGLGVMLDDVIAGLMALGILQGLIYLGAPL
jgi:phosphatidylglycerophosphatase A